MKRMLIAASILLSIVGMIAFIVESESMLPTSPKDSLEKYVGEYIVVEGTISRMYETKGNIFIALQGDYNVEINLFYGIVEKMEKIPKLGEWASAKGVLERVPLKYRKQYWPPYSLTIESPSEIYLCTLNPQLLESCDSFDCKNAGKILAFSGQVTSINGTISTVCDIELSIDGVDVADYVEGKVLVVEDNGKVNAIIMELSTSGASLSFPDTAFEEALPYCVKGTVCDLRPYHSGMLIALEKNTSLIEVFVKGDINLSNGDSIIARGIWKSYYGKYRLVCSSILSLEVL